MPNLAGIFCYGYFERYICTHESKNIIFNNTHAVGIGNEPQRRKQ